MNKKIILFTLVLAGLFLAMAVVSLLINKQSREKIISAPQIKSSLPVTKEKKPEAQQVEVKPPVVEQEARLPSGVLLN